MEVTMEVTTEVTAKVTAEVAALLRVVHGEMSRQELQAAIGLKHAEHFRKDYVLPTIAAGCLEMTLPNQPNSRLQRYRLTEKGKQWLPDQAKRGGQ
jgi:ATP-dependent DNA helicase RecG